MVPQVFLLHKKGLHYKMKQTNTTLEFHKIIDLLTEYAYTQKAKEELLKLEPILSETELRHALKETTEARTILDKMGMPPLVSLESMNEILMIASKGGCLTAGQLEAVGNMLTAVRRMKDFLARCKMYKISLAFYEEQMEELPELAAEIAQKIRGSKVDDFASKYLKDIRRDIERTDSNMRSKAESLMKNNKECFSDSYITIRNGRICLPVKKEYKFRINGSVIDKSSTGATLFIEPTTVSQMFVELSNLKIEEENEERRILYELTARVSDEEAAFLEDIRLMEKLDYIFAKGKMSYDMAATEPSINTERHIAMEEARHPFLSKENCVPLDFSISMENRGIIITGPNTGGKTVCIKTVGLLNMMAQSGLHVPCKSANFTMNSKVLCDIGDGQNITENLSTFSAHIKNVLAILKEVDRESLVIMDELGSGTDPAEGMGIAVAILEELRKSNCLFLVTTHYPEIKAYAEKTEGILNARMTFDRESLRPLYQLKIGEAGESCAFYIAKQLGMPEEMIQVAQQAACHAGKETVKEDLFADWKGADTKQEKVQLAPSSIKKQRHQNSNIQNKDLFQKGDSVMIYPDKKIGIVCEKMNDKGVLEVQLKDKKIWINHKRVKLHVKAENLYPEDYDFSIVFDSVETRKARHQMERKYCEDLQIEVEK